jgi:hypothetical protein
MLWLSTNPQNKNHPMKQNELMFARIVHHPLSSHLFSLSWVLLLSLLTACQMGKSAKVTSQSEFAGSNANKPQVIYIADFELSAANVKHEEGKLSGRTGPGSRITDRVGGRLSGASADPQARAREIIESMSNSLLKDLSKAGFNAQRLAPGASLPNQGWLLRGIFVEVQEGNRVRRAMVGLGQGQTDIQVVTSIDDLSQGTPKPLYQVATDANSGSAVGAAPTLVLGPYGAAARFVMAGQDLDKNVKQTATQITAQITQRFQASK